jgi:hypothetical protein
MPRALMPPDVPVKASELEGAVTGPLVLGGEFAAVVATWVVVDVAPDDVVDVLVAFVVLVVSMVVEVVLVVGMVVDVVLVVGMVVDVVVVDVVLVELVVVVELVGGLGNEGPITVSKAWAMTFAPESTGSSPNPSVWPAAQVMSSHVQALSTATGTVPQGDDTMSVVSEV